jgi:hypothetical protein
MDDGYRMLNQQAEALLERSSAMRRQAADTRQHIEGVARNLEQLDVRGVLLGMRRFAEIVRSGR